MARKWALTAESRTGDRVNVITGEPKDTVTVYDEADLNRRVAAAETDPRNLDVTVREIH
ncbi:hypothetical protein ACIP9H_33915 [Streptomyces sp. NPDC088732]|uniref:hypothetical protein n=1 Tax=Streptomyces sp. NPDC088732 TaxID=3365879 RepID=UPI00381BD5ED